MKFLISSFLLVSLCALPALTGDTHRAAIHVSSTTGTNNPTCGDVSSPCQTIGYGLSRAADAGYSEVNVSAGTYLETVTLIDGIGLRGGYSSDFTQWDPAMYISRVEGILRPVHTKTVIAVNLTTSTTIEAFEIVGQDNVATRGNSYAVYVSESPGLRLINNHIIAGTAGSGTDGADGNNGQNGTPGGGGSSPSYNAYDTDAHPCGESRQHSEGGVRYCGASNVSGGNGGGNECPPAGGTHSSAKPGSAGEGSGGGMGGQGGVDGSYSMGGSCTPATDGQNAASGQSGPDGNGGLAGTDPYGTVAGSEWQGYAGSDGQNGGHGSGGGGGGAGGGVEGNMLYSDRLGAHGGSGGSGGCGGEGGSGGTSGGGSFGVFIVGGGAPTIEGNIIDGGNGGPGGDGGIGGFRGSGGLGGNGGSCAAECGCAGSGGNGGNGGDGGHGGGGGGACGGVSFGIYAWQVTSSVDLCAVLSNTITTGSGGTGGSGGASAGMAGESGPAGMAGACIMLNSTISGECGDANSDGTVNVSDAVYIISYIFKGGPPPNPLCVGDANGDGPVNVSDAVYIISYIFKGGPAPVDDCCE